MQRIKISLKGFLATGLFGSVRLGMTRAEVTEVVGKPEGWGPETYSSIATIWRYGSVEFHFPARGGGLTTIFCDGLTDVDGGAYFDIDGWVINHDLSLAMAEKALEDAYLSFVKDERFAVEVIELKLESGVKLSFHPDEAGQYFLGAFALAESPREKAATRQISVTLPLHLYERAHRAAAKEKRSIAHLCSELLSAKIAELPEDE